MGIAKTKFSGCNMVKTNQVSILNIGREHYRKHSRLTSTEIAPLFLMNFRHKWLAAYYAYLIQDLLKSRNK